MLDFADGLCRMAYVPRSNFVPAPPQYQRAHQFAPTVVAPEKAAWNNFPAP